MIINGGSRSNGAFFASHLMRTDHNERVTIAEMRGFTYAGNLREAFAELRDMADETRCKNFFYHANINTRADETLTPEQWAEAVERLEIELRLTGQPRFVVEHDKEGRVHRHVVWGRIDSDTMTAIPDSHNYRTHELVATELEAEFGHQATARALTRDKETTPRPEPRAHDWETFRAQQSKVSPDAMKAELTELWRHADTGPAFAAALEERGYILARGDRRDFCVVDVAGHEHSLGRRIEGVKAAGIRERMAGVERDMLPSVAEARELARSRWEDTASGGAVPAETAEAFVAEPIEAAQSVTEAKPVAADPAPQDAAPSPFETVMAERIKEMRPANEAKAAPADKAAAGEEAPFERIMRETAREARDDTASEDEGGGRWERFNAWLSNVREHVVSFGQQLREHWSGYFGGGEKEAEAPAPAPETPSHASGVPDTTVSGAGAHIEPMQARSTGPELG